MRIRRGFARVARSSPSITVCLSICCALAVTAVPRIAFADTPVPPINQTFDGGNGDNGHVGTLIISPGDGDNGGNGGSPILVFPALPGPQIIQFPGPPAGVFIKSNGGNGGDGGDADVCVCSGGNGGHGGAGGNSTVTIGPNLSIATNAFGVSGIWIQSAGGVGGNGGSGNGSFSAGDGGVGGVGGNITLNAFDAVTTSGDQSFGIFAQSLGGGGGSGGGGLNFGGGSGGTSEAGGIVTVNLFSGSSIQTSGRESLGVLAQSVGGFGGSGGSSSFGIASFSGGGGNGGNGGDVNVNTQSGSSIVTYGDAATALEADSIGGAGGEGGSGLSLFFTNAGSGSAGGSGANVIVFNGATITTNGASAKGILAQTIGGGGGNGGSGSSLIVGLGGAGSTTSPGGDILIDNTGNVTTNSASALSSGALFGSQAIFGQSVGGGGGNGGSTFGLFSVGGSGGGGGDGGSVDILNSGTLVTHANDSDTIFAQSVGGGGGNGGGSVAVGATFSAAIGGSAGIGGSGSDVFVSSGTGSLQTFGDRSNAIQAQSVGGGGGNAGFAISGSGGIVSASLGVGGTGGKGGDGGTVTVFNGIPAFGTTGSAIVTSGANAHGIFAQSTGGGGGSGGFSISASGGIGAASFGVGGKGGTGGDGGTVGVQNNASISTGGTNASAILAQSVGGGGGDAGFSITGDVGAASGGFSFGGSGARGGNGGDVNVANGGFISTVGSDSSGVFAQTVGGGGGSGGMSVTGNVSWFGSAGMSLGGSAGAGGNAGSVLLANIGGVQTSGDRSNGVAAQSVGGGGGHGGFSVTGNVSVGPNAGVSIGGSGGNGGNGGTVNLSNTAGVSTFGNDANALFAQSAGGGGGDGGFDIAGGVSGAATLNASIGGSGGNGGSASDVTVMNGTKDHGAALSTSQSHSNGIAAQSIAGGGGNGGFSIGAGVATGAAVALGIGGSGGSGNSSGIVTVTNFGEIDTGTSENASGDFSNGIIAQSIAGGGGNGGFSVAGGLASGAAANIGLGGSGGSGGNAGDVDVTSVGPISTNGKHADAILAQSIGGGGGNGAFAIAGGFATGAAIGIGVGGSGSAGGSGGGVDLSNTGGLVTTGDDSSALVAQSVGGGGGYGGFSIAGNLSGGLAANATVGGSGGAGANGGSVTLASSAGPGKCPPSTRNCPPIVGSIITAGNRSDGITAQSIAGGGGNGGFSISAGGGYAAAISEDIGGNGASGGSAGEVFVNSADNITTGAASSIGGAAGDSSDGIRAQSLGGGGGSGGFDIAGGVGNNLAATISIGGSGGNGGSSAGVFVSSHGTIATNGDHASAILAQSMGGGGGDGGFSIAGSLSQGPGLGLSIGGAGGNGSSAGDVRVTSIDRLTTNGNDASGIFAQSVGGGGGNAGFSVAGGLSGSVALNLSIGGTGGNGASSGNVSIVNGVATEASPIVTRGARSDAIVAQSIGGSGGNGGFSIAGGVAEGPAMSLGIGGSGGSGATAGTVNVSSIGDISTGASGGGGDFSNGIRAQSIGGNGGSGGWSVAAGLASSLSASVGIGGVGENGANAGAVVVNYGNLGTATFGGTITTNGSDANGILAQSVGGGGGAGGFSVAASLSTSPGVGFSLGGSGGDGGAGSSVGVGNFGNIGTAGNNSSGILAQSIGGGGGHGGLSVAGALSQAPSLAVSIGGFGGAGASSSSVTVANVGVIGTGGNNSGAIVAQSIAGGGGNGGFSAAGVLSGGTAASLSIGGFAGAGNKAGDVVIANLNPLTAINAPTIFTLGSNSDGLLAQSVGGAGGNGGSSASALINNGFGVSASLGGFGGSGSASGNVIVINHATIATFGRQSDGIAAQAVGGGGGAGGFSIAGTISNATSAALSLGGFGGGGGTGGNVIVAHIGTGIVTLGDESTGLLAQSVGGGGGHGGFSIGADLDTHAAASLSLGGSSGGGGNAGNVSVISGQLKGVANFIGTGGAQSDAILAQSVGGGGGDAGWSVAGTVNDSKGGVSLTMGGFGGAGGDAGSVAVDANTLVITTGDQSTGIAAQSIGGAGGNGGWSVGGVLSTGTNATLSLGGNGGTAGNAGRLVRLTSGQNVTTNGNNADALLAQSIGGGGGNGAFSIGAGLTSSGIQLADSFGGNGGSAGSGGSVNLASGTSTAQVTIETHGAASDGILAQSLGGGGGAGGFTVNASATGDGDGQPDAAKFGVTAFNIGYGTCTVCPGSGGGDANNAGDVLVNSNSVITTHGDNANDIAAQSIGGGGGKGALTIGATLDKNGPSAQMQFGSGGGGGNASDVHVLSAGDLATNGANSDGILAQSVGGGGGFGGLSATNGLITDIPGVGGLDLGQHGDQGGNAANVTVTNTSNIVTKGGNSSGIVAQSLGGGGGEGGWSIQGGLSLEPGVANSILNYALGSNGGGGGNAGDTLVINTAKTITTSGSKADGILAQSTGGGGGNGGFAINGAITPGWAIGFAMGGRGAAAGNAGTVTVGNASDITSAGDLAGGIVAQSTGGGGGSGGFAIEGLGTTGLTLTTSLGGFSSGGTDGNTVLLANVGSIGTSGNDADDILAQSVGGGGGNGGWSISGAATTGRGAFFGLGATGGNGGNGGSVEVVNTAAILLALGDNSAGLVAQSMGGGGGNAGFALAGGLTSKGTVDLALGGAGATGGNGGAVLAASGTASHPGTIQTLGENADGFLAQSLGGGGGLGGFAIGGGVTDGPSINVSLGGSGGTGGTGGAVTLINRSIVETTGSHSDAVSAQSLGGGGGDAGFSIATTLNGGNSIASATLSLGGNGGNGGSAGLVGALNLASTIATQGDFSGGFVAQSVGGGGGTGAFSISGTGSIGKRNLTLGFGGNGGDGGRGGSVNLTSGSTAKTTAISTRGAFANGILAQSVGGGGGAGGFAVEGLASPGQSFGFDLGGSGGVGNDAGEVVNVTNFSAITTAGDSSNGIAAQNIGGGGGAGGFKVSAKVSADSDGFGTTDMFGFGNGGGGGNAHTVDVVNSGTITTTGLNGNGILAQSIGGGGGFGGFSYATQLLGDLGIGLGATTDGGGDAGKVSVTNHAAISTAGDNGGDIVAQSVGGGGGAGALSISGALNSDPTSILSGLNLALGSNGGKGGDGGTVTVTSDATMLISSGANANGILAQSLGAGGGDGGFALAADLTKSKYGLGLSLGGNAGAAGNGGAVTVVSDSSIATTGSQSDGILAQSAGGGGGNGGFAVNVLLTAGLSGNLSVGGSGGSSGNGGDVIVASGLLTNPKPTIATTGFDASAIVAQSLGGGGGNGSLGLGGPIPIIPVIGMGLGGNSSAAGNGGTVTAVSETALTTSGDFSNALLAQSLGGGGGTAAIAVSASMGAQTNGTVTIGATSGFGGSGGTVEAGNLGAITTSGLQSTGVVAQSVGAGGGIAGLSVSGDLTDSKPGGLQLGALAATCPPTSNNDNCGRASGSGGAVAEVNGGTIKTSGDAASGMLAQSIGGGGGVGVISVDGSYSGSSLEIVAGAFASGGNANNVAIDNVQGGTIVTSGFHADGIAAQSIGGGGGFGTVLVDNAINGGTTLLFDAGATEGAGNGGAIAIQNRTTVSTTGASSTAILAQSVGGGGGDAAFDLGGSLATGGLGAIDLLGAQSIAQTNTSGNGGAIAIVNRGALSASGAGSDGILAQSIGGGGGKGAYSGTLNAQLRDGAIVAYLLGGIGDAGDAGGAVSVRNMGSISTSGTGGGALIAQSIGGGGGDTGYALDLALGTSGAASLGVAAGGGPNSSNASDAVVAINSGTLTTAGSDAPAIVAQSIAGGGGDGGFTATGTLTTTPGINQFTVSPGGRGGSGNTAKTAGVNNSATITTRGDRSSAIVAQSIGDGGGNTELQFTGAFTEGTPNGASVTVGATAGAGNGDAVNVMNTGGILTGMPGATVHGEFSYGVLAQSIGGGGGTGLMTLGLGVPTATGATGNVSVHVGGPSTPFGAIGGGQGSNATLNDSGPVGTIGGGADALVAQSIGGGGGIGEADIFGTSFITTAAKPAAFNLGITVGGGGGVGNDGGTVSLMHDSGRIVTNGDDATAVLAQSIGGGGGIGGSADSIKASTAECSTALSACSAQEAGLSVGVGGSGPGQNNGGAVSVGNVGDIATKGFDSVAILAQSIGGGGGIAGDASGTTLQNWNVHVGGSSQSSGNGSDVTVNDSGAILTQGAQSSGIFAQSIGAGGGIGGLGVTSVNATGTIALGAASLAAGNGGAVSVTMNNTSPSRITTHGDGAFGIFAQSVGGGGGIAGNINGGVSKTIIGNGSTLTATGGGGGNGADVTVTDNGDVQTLGDAADGIFAQSVGGGGGLVGPTTFVTPASAFAGSAGAFGSAGNVSVTQKGIIATSGAGADAIFAQSAGGFGTAGNVSVAVNGMALAYGANADGITAQSIGGLGDGNITVNIGPGSVVQGGTGSGSAGVRFLGGAVNTLVNLGTITTAATPVPYPFALTGSGVNTPLGTLMTSDAPVNLSAAITDRNYANGVGTAVIAGGDSFTFDNFGKVLGSIALDAGTLHLTNYGVFVTGSRIDLGANGLLTLAGGSIITPGGGGFLATSTIAGDLIQQPGSQYLVTADILTNTTSKLSVTGAASMAGSIDLLLIDTSTAKPGSYTTTDIFSARDGVTYDGLTLTPPKSAVASFDLYRRSHDIGLGYTVDFDPRGLSGNDAAFGDYINRVQLAGSSPKLASLIAAVFAAPDMPALRNAYQHAGSGVAAFALSSSVLQQNLTFSNSMLHCHDEGIISGNNCGWATFGASNYDETATSSSVGFAQNSTGFSTGFQHAIGDGRSQFGAAFHYDNGSVSDASSGATFTGPALAGGIALGRTVGGDVSVSAGLDAGFGNYTSSRTAYPNAARFASGAERVSYLGAHLRAERHFQNARTSLTPFIDIGATRVNSGAIDETGAGGLNQHVDAYGQTYPTAQLGAAWKTTWSHRGTQYFASLDASVTQVLGTTWSATSVTLEGAPSGIAPFQVTNTIDRTYVNLAPSIQISNGSKIGIRLGGTYQFSTHTHGLGAFIQFETRL